MGTDSQETLGTTERSLDIALEVQKRGGAQLGDIAEAFDIAKSTAYKHLNTLESRGYLVKEGNRYYIGLKFTNRGEYARVRKPGYRIAADKVDELSRRTDEEVDFAVDNDNRALIVHLSYDRTNPYQEGSVDQSNKHWRTGTYYHLHCIGTGKALLSQFSRAEVEAVIDQWGLPQRTPATITDPDELHEECERIRDQGYAHSQGEYTEGLSAIARPVIQPDGTVLGSLSVNGPSYRLQDRLDDLRTILDDVVEDFESELEDVEYPDPFSEGSML